VRYTKSVESDVELASDHWAAQRHARTRAEATSEYAGGLQSQIARQSNLRISGGPTLRAGADLLLQTETGRALTTNTFRVT